MLGKIIQPSLYEGDLFRNSQAAAKTALKDLGRNLEDAFGVTKKILHKGHPDVIKYILYGMNNLEFDNPKFDLEIVSRENAGEILANRFSAGLLKQGNLHIHNEAKIPLIFSKLVPYMNDCSYGNKKFPFASLASEFEEYFNIKQSKRFELLEQSTEEDIGGGFVKAFCKPYKFSDKENSVKQDFHDPENKGDRIEMIHGKLMFLSNEANKLWG